MNVRVVKARETVVGEVDTINMQLLMERNPCLSSCPASFISCEYLAGFIITSLLNVKILFG